MLLPLVVWACLTLIMLDSSIYLLCVLFCTVQICCIHFVVVIYCHLEVYYLQKLTLGAHIIRKEPSYDVVSDSVHDAVATC